MKRFVTLDAAVGQVICEAPFVKLLTKPKMEEIELAPGWMKERWTAVAQVEDTLAVVELTVKEL